MAASQISQFELHLVEKFISQSSLCFGPPDPGFMYHWTLKVADLKQTLLFLENGLGMHVIRHEEHDAPCPITCNGPFDSPWSKTMVGYGLEESSFVLELIYNYTQEGEGYTLGNGN